MKASSMPIVATNLKTMVGPVKWSGEPVKNVTRRRWSPASGSARATSRPGDHHQQAAPDIPVGGELQLLA